jgi:hypothetical protein
VAIELVCCRPSECAPEQWEAIVELRVRRFVREVYRRPEDVERVYGVPPGTRAFAERWAQLEEWARRDFASGGEQQVVSALFLTRPNGGCVALAAVTIARGTGNAPICATIGLSSSEIPTHRTLQDFSYALGEWRTLGHLPESAVAELGALAKIGREEWARSGIDRSLTAEERAVLKETRGGLYPVIAAALRHEFARLDPPQIVLFNTRPRFATSFAAFGFALLPLFLNGVAPTPRTLDPRRWDAPHFAKWEGVLRATGRVPETVLGQGVGPAIEHLANTGFADWAALDLSLPYALRNDAETARALGRMETACGTFAASLQRASAR